MSKKKPTDLLFDVGDDESLKPSKYPSPPIKSLRLATIEGEDHEDVALTKYKEEYIERLIKMASSGYSIRAFCASIDVSFATYQKWRSNIPAFAEAVEIANMKRHLFYEHQGITNLNNRNFNCALFDRLTKSVAKWKDDEQVITHNHTHTLKRPEEMSPMERRERIRELQSKLGEACH